WSVTGVQTCALPISGPDLRHGRDPLSGLRVVFLRHLSLPKELAGVSQLRMAKAWQRVASVAEVRPWFLRDSPGFQLAPELAPLRSEEGRVRRGRSGR